MREGREGGREGGKKEADGRVEEKGRTIIV